MRKILFGLILLILTSCKGQNSKSTEVNNSTGSKFEWNFSEQRKFVYSFSQTSNGANKMDKDSSTDKTYVTANGHLNVRVKENNLADLSLTDIEMKMVNFDQGETPRDTITQKTPATVVQDMKPDGSFGDSKINIFFEVLFPLPKKILKKGESDEITMQMPFNANGSRLYAKGQNTLTFKGYDEVGGKNCAVLEGIIDISKLDIPEELDGEYKCSTTGKATYYFNLENSYYVGSDIQMVMEVMMDSESDNENSSGIYMEMKNDNVFKIRLEKIEE